MDVHAPCKAVTGSEQYNGGMACTLTRREWAAALAPAVPLLAGLPSAVPQDSPEKLQAEAATELAADLKSLKEFPLPMAVEPAFVFKP